jgi:restriction system protein
MTIPTYDALMLPVLRFAAQQTWAMRDLIARISDDLGLSPAERDQMLPGGTGTVIGSRVGWAKTYLKKAGLVEQPQRSQVRITQRGRSVLAKPPERIDIPFLLQFAEFRTFKEKTASAETHAGAAPKGDAGAPSATPEEQIAAANTALTEALRDALLARVLEASPAFFERLVIDLLLKMGYGGTLEDPAEHRGRSGDGGIDGMIREDQLGLDQVYLQAKRYKPGNVVGPEVVQAFIGALVNRGAHKGVLMTTSSFSTQARMNAKQSGNLRLVLIDGSELTDLMVRFNVGVRVADKVEIKRIDSDYFGSDENE